MIDHKKLLVDLNCMCHSYDWCTHCDLFDRGICDGHPSEISLYRIQELSDIVSKWAAQHQAKTYLSEFLERYPNAPLTDNGIPSMLCPGDLGYDNLSDCCPDFCTQCWNQPIRGDDKS